jgi:6-phosphofructokinase 1
MPERAFDTARFLTDVEHAVATHGLCTIAVSEGIADANGEAMITKLMQTSERDDHGNVQLSGTGALGDLLTDTIRRELKLKRVRADTFGYLQRCFVGCRSDRDAHEAREVGEKAVQFAMWDNVDGSVVIRRPVLDYSVDYALVPLEKVAGKTRHMPDHFINAAGNGVTEDFHSYCRPLLGSGVPETHRLRAPAVPKILNP